MKTSNMKFLPLLVILVIVAISCNKDKFTTIPQYKIESISPGTVFNGDIVSLKGQYTDKEGDIDSAFVVYKWYNGSTIVRNDTFLYSIADMGIPLNTTKADLDVDFEYNTNNTGLVPLPAATIRDTTATLGVLLIDKQHNRSVYAESDPIRLKKP